jgi:hypothetical protein
MSFSNPHIFSLLKMNDAALNLQRERIKTETKTQKRDW